jgi:hypothetical protein
MASPNITSVFDLSPSEKLQLVEDLWDDLAATPEQIPQPMIGIKCVEWVWEKNS